jgi:predicted lipoprotein with Yx(FWY)xxD motif
MLFAFIAAAALVVGLAGVGTDYSSAETAQPKAGGTAVRTASSRFGRILVDGRGRTLYLFEKDARGKSRCFGTCAVYWPPLLAPGHVSLGPGLERSLVGVTKRGSAKQVTYGGHPLYRFAGDSRPGQTTGQNLHDFGAGWYVVSPGGRKIERAGGQ